MFGIHDFGLFLAAGILLNLTPGPDTVYILGRSVAQGREAGVASALGICIGSIFHTCAAALGLSAILATSALAFGAIKLLGGVYLIFLGIKMLLDRRKHLSLPSNFRRRTIAAAFRQLAQIGRRALAHGPIGGGDLEAVGFRQQPMKTDDRQPGIFRLPAAPPTPPQPPPESS